MPNYEQTEGFAVVFEGKTQIATVSDSKRAAMINWLVVHSQIMILNSHTDQDISRLWVLNSGPAEVVNVMVHRRMAIEPGSMWTQKHPNADDGT